MYKIANATLFVSVALTGADAKRVEPKPAPKPVPKVDPYKNDPVDVRPAFEGFGALYSGFLNGVYGRGYADEECMNETSVKAVQDIIHHIAAGDVNNITKLIEDGQNAFNGFQVCDFESMFDGFANHCTENPQACKVDKISKRATSHMMNLIGSAQDMVTVMTQLSTDNKKEKVEDLGKIGTDLGKIVKDIFAF